MRWLLVALALGCFTADSLAQPAPPAAPLSQEEETMEAATRVLREVMAVPLKGIPASLLNEAQGVAVVPGMIRGGFIIGVNIGRGVVIVRDRNGAWQSPNFITMAGGGIGWQAGLQSTDLVLVFRSRASVENLMRGKFTVGADASVAAGPVGRQVSAGTDARPPPELFSYSRSRGLFAGVALDGAVIQIDNRANAAFYRADRPYPQAALNFITTLSAFSHAPTPTPGGNDADAVSRNLIESSNRLNRVLDPQWQQYLALPTDIRDADSLAPVRARFQLIQNDPNFRALSERHEFQETYALLNRYIALSTAHNSNVLQLPPPPK